MNVTNDGDMDLDDQTPHNAPSTGLPLSQQVTPELLVQELLHSCGPEDLEH